MTEVAAFDGGEIDGNQETSPDSLSALEGIGIINSSIATAATIVIRMNTTQSPYDDVRVRQAAQLAVDNNKLLELGINGTGIVAENHHVGAMHPEYADVGPQVRNVEQANALLAEAGQSEHEYEIISVDVDWIKNTTDAVAAQLRDAGLKVKRTVLPGSTFWNDWTKYPFSSTNWNPRPLGVQVLSLAYRSGVPWNESSHSNPKFDALLDKALATPDVEARRAIMTDLETMLRDSGVIIQPYWRSYFRSYRKGVHGFEMQQGREQHLDLVWLES